MSLSPATLPGACASSSDTAPSSREKILDTAEALFARRGFGGVGLREVARVSGFSKSALFHHFPSKVNLYTAVLERILGDLFEAIAHLPAAGGALARLISHIEAIIDSLVGSPPRAPLLLRALFEDEVLEGDQTSLADVLLDRILDTLRSIMVEGVTDGELRPVPVPHALQSLIGMVVFHFASGKFGDDTLGGPVFSAAEIRRFKQFIVSFIENGLAARPQPA